MGDQRADPDPTGGPTDDLVSAPTDDLGSAPTDDLIEGPADDVASDLVAYLVVALPDVSALAGTAPSLVAMVESGTVGLLDLVVISRSPDGTVEVRELGATAELASLAAVTGELGGLLTEHDIELVSLALPPGTTGLVLVTEDRWAAPLSAAAHRAGGRILAGERIPAARIEAALSGRGDDGNG